MKYLLTFLGSAILIAIIFYIVGMAATHYGEDSPQFITAIVGTIIVILLLVLFGNKVLKSEIKLKDILNGLPAIATVTNCYQSGQSASTGGATRYYQLIIEVNVSNPQGETWPAKIKQMFPITQIGMFQPGVCFAVKYDPNHRSKVVFAQSQR
ncbi:MAG: hypothetical protein M9898_14365 [Chitinophagaceae bacterium]|nr:hypothetical protein [Chitinophagaceae bacterium]